MRASLSPFTACTDTMLRRSLPGLSYSSWWLGAILLAAAWLLAWLPLPVAGALLAAATFGAILLIWPVVGLYALVLILPFAPVMRISMGPATVGPTDLLLAATALAWFLQHVALGRRFRPLPLLWLILPFFLALLYSTLAAASLEQALPELVKWVEFLVIYGLGVQLLDRQHRFPLLVAILVAAAVEAGLGLVQFLFRLGPESFQLGPYLRAYGTFRQPNPFAGYLGLVLPLGLALTLWAGERAWARRHQRKAALLQLLLAGLLAVLVVTVAAGIVASWSRGAWLGVLASSVVVLLLYSTAGRMAVLVGAGLALLASPLFPAALKARLLDVARYFGTWNARGAVITDANYSVLERVAHWQAAWEMFADHFWLGVGVGNWDTAYSRYAIPPWYDPMGHAHNVLFHYAAVAGIFGALTYLWMWLGALAAALLSVARNRGLQRSLSIGVAGLLIHLSVHNQLDNLWVQGMPLLIALALSLLDLRPTGNQRG
ncbi:MAG: O-antigen ligase domain-containing protein [Chloroflexi bacterium]|nr:MAG: O-antigen ligase domain-containing protein [Chloroflexota bacterium]